jgi:hypothetical protein
MIRPDTLPGLTNESSANEIEFHFHYTCPADLVRNGKTRG